MGSARTTICSPSFPTWGRLTTARGNLALGRLLGRSVESGCGPLWGRSPRLLSRSTVREKKAVRSYKAPDSPINFILGRIAHFGRIVFEERKVKSMMRNGTNTSFSELKQIDAGVLNVGYAEAGKSDSPVVMLLHGWPYDIHSYVDVAPRLAQAGYRVIVPYLRGYGTTRFLSSDTFRNGQQSVVAVDLIALLDALKIERAILAGFDWGARTVELIAWLWP